MPKYVEDERLTPAQIVNDLGAVVAQAYAELERKLTARVAALLSEGIPAPDDILARIEALQELEKYAREQVQALAPTIGREFVQLAAVHGVQAALAALLPLPNLPRDGGLYSQAARAVEALAADLTNRLEVLNQRILRWPQDVYQRIVAAQVPAILTGVDTLGKTHRDTVSRFLASGVDSFVDVSNRVWRIGTYAEMATRTATLRAWSDAGIQTMQAVGINTVTVIVGNNACEKCAQWAGKVLSTDGTPAGTHRMRHATDDNTEVLVPIAATLDEARAQGFQHPNCRCAIVAYLPGLTVPGDMTTYDRDRERERIRQRELEVQLRQLKRQLAAELDPDERADLKRHIREVQATLRAHLDEANLNRRRTREQVWFADGRRIVGKVSMPPSGEQPKPHEVATATRLSRHGISTQFREVQHGDGVKNPDAEIDGNIWEFKSPEGSSEKNTISEQFKSARKQARRLVIDLARCGLPDEVAMPQIARRFHGQKWFVQVIVLDHRGGITRLP